MKNILFPTLAIFNLVMIQSCAVQNHSTTVERDKENGCTVHLILQIGIDGNDSDVIAVRDQLEECYSKKCVIPCENDNSKGCEVLSHPIVKKWSELSSDEQKIFHHITMVNNDGLPSNAHIGTPNGESTSYGTWRRNEPPRTYCHEVLHLAGLKDQYCSRVYDTVTHTSNVEVSCVPPPDPDGGNCCTATPQQKRCGLPCAGHEHDLMATLAPDLSCSNIMDVIILAGLNSCPKECCPGPRTGYQPPQNYFFIGPSYLHFGDKDIHYGSFGFTGEYTRFFNPKIGATLDVGLYFHNEKQTDYKIQYQQLNITAGITYLPGLQVSKLNSKISFSTHALIGVSNYTNKVTSGIYGSNKTTEHSLNLNIGVGLDWSINKSYSIRMLQVDYTPTFFAKTIQNNYRISAGAIIKFPSRKR